jgi:hypothetical protein
MTMLKSATALLLLVTCVAVLTACGDSGSSSSATTASSTTPTGRLGNAGCDAPRVNGLTVTGFTFGGIDCGTAQQKGLEMIKTNKTSGWTCAIRISGRQTTTNCVNPSNSAQYVNTVARAA